ALSLTISAPGYTAQTLDVTFDDGDLALGTVTIDAAGQAFDVPRRTALPLERDVALQPLPVSLAGRVVDRSDPAQGIAGAQLTVTAPVPRGPVASGPHGFFRLDALPVALEIEVRVAAAGFDTLHAAVRLDHGT